MTDESPAFQPWELHLFDQVIRSEDISIGLAEKVEKETEVRWPALRYMVNVTGEAGRLRKTAAVLIADRLQLSLDDAYGKIDGLSYSELSAAVVLGEDDKPTSYSNGFPTGADEDSTPT